jgi:chemotaxis protein CheC
MEETGNIIGTAFLNGIAASLNLELYPSSPIVTCDYSGAILETMMAHVAMRGEYALSCQISFHSSHDEMAGIFALLPEDISVWGRV